MALWWAGVVGRIYRCTGMCVTLPFPFSPYTGLRGTTGCAGGVLMGRCGDRLGRGVEALYAALRAFWVWVYRLG